MKEPQTGILYLIPTVLEEGTEMEVLPPEVRSIVGHTTHFLVEDARTARRFISSLKLGIQITELKFYILDKDTTREKVKSYFLEIPPSENIGVISEAGCPGIADPGALAVEEAHLSGRRVHPVVGPSSILLALMASGFNGQSFTFHGYIPIDSRERIKFLQQMEQDAVRSRRTQIFMETPFRNNQIVKDVLSACNPETLFCIASNLTSEKEFIKTMKIKKWKSTVPELHKQPCIFLLYS